MINTKTVYENRGIKIVREQSYGFRSNTLSSTWIVYNNDKFAGSFIRLKDARAWADKQYDHEFERREEARIDAMLDARYADEPTEA